MKERDNLLVTNVDGLGILMKVEYADMDWIQNFRYRVLFCRGRGSRLYTVTTFELS